MKKADIEELMKDDVPIEGFTEKARQVECARRRKEGLIQAIFVVFISIPASYAIYYGVVDPIINFKKAPMTYIKASVDTPPEEIKPGTLLTFSVTIDKTEEGCNVFTRHHLIDSKLYQQTLTGVIYQATPKRDTYEVNNKLPKGIGTYKRAVTLPTDAYPGPAVIMQTNDYYCSWLHRLFGPINKEVMRLRFDIQPTTGPAVNNLKPNWIEPSLNKGLQK